MLDQKCKHISLPHNTMRKTKVILLSLAGLLALFIILAAIAAMILDNEDYRKILTMAVERYTGYDVDIRGDFELDLSTEPSLTASDIQFKPGRNGTQLPMTRIGRIYIKLAATQLLTGAAWLKQLTVEDVIISLVIGEDKQARKEKQQSKKIKYDIPVPIFQSVTLRNIIIDLSDIDKGHLFKAQMRQFSIADDPNTGLRYVKGEGLVDIHDFKIEGQLGSLKHILDHTKPYPIALDLKSEGLDFKLTGKVDDPIKGEGLELLVFGEVSEVSNFLKLFKVDIPGMGRLELEANITGNIDTPKASDIFVSISHGPQFGLAAKGSVKDITSGKGTDIEIRSSSNNKDIIQMLLPDILADFTNLGLHGYLRDYAEDFVLEKITADGSNDQGLLLNAAGSLNFGRFTNDPPLKELDLDIQLTSPTTESAKRFLVDILPEMGPVAGKARLTGPIERLSLEGLDININESSPLKVKSKGRIDWIPIDDRPISGVDLALIVQSEQTQLLASAFDLPLPELGSVSINSRLRYSNDQLEFDQIDARTSHPRGMKVGLSGRADINLEEVQKSQGQIHLQVLVTAPNMGAAEPLLGARYFPELGPVKAQAKINGNTTVMSFEDIAITAGQSNSLLMECQGRIGRCTLSGDQPLSDVDVRGSIKAKETSAFAALAGISLPNLGPLKGTWRLVDRRGNYAIANMQVLIGDIQDLNIKATGKIDSLVRHGKISLNGLDLDITAAAPNVNVIPVLAELDPPDLGPLQMKGKMAAGKDSLDIKEFTVHTGSKEKATLFMKGKVLSIENPKKTALTATFRTNTQPWIKKLMHRSAPENYLHGTLKISGATDVLRIEKFKIVTEDKKPLSFETSGIVKKRNGSFETDFRIKGDAEDPSVMGSISGISFPAFNSIALNGRCRTDGQEINFEGETRFGKTYLKTIVNHSKSHHRPGISAKISSPAVYLSDLGIYPEYLTEKNDRKKEDTKKNDRLFSKKPLQFKTLKAFNFSISIDVDKLIGEKHEINKLSLNASLNDGVLNISPSQLSYPEGDITFESTLDATGPKPAFTFKANAEDIDMGAVLEHAHKQLILGGNLNLAVDLHSVGSSPHEMASSLKGDFGIAIENGRIKRDVEMLTADAVDLLTALPKIQKYQDMNCLTLRFKFEDGIGKSEIMFLDTPNVTTRGVGTIDLVSETLDFVLQPKPKKGLPGLSSAIRIQGSLANPSVRKMPYKEAARLYGEIFAPYVFLPARGLGYLWYLMKKDKDEESPCLNLESESDQ